MGVSKVILNGQTLIDVTQKTVAANNLLSPNTALDAAGSDVVGEIATKNATNLSASGSVVTAPSGYYATDVSKAIASGSAIVTSMNLNRTPNITLDSSTGVVTASIPYQTTSVSGTVTSGYISSIKTGNIGVVGSSSYQLSATSASVYTPSSVYQYILPGTYLTGTQTIIGDANLIPENIAEDVSIFGVVGTHIGGTVYTCTIIESNSTSNNFAIWYDTNSYYTTNDSFHIKDDGTTLYFLTEIQSSSVKIYYNGILDYWGTSGEVFYPINQLDANITVELYDGEQDGQESYVKIFTSNALQSKMGITPSSSSQVITADSNYYGLSSVGINAIDSNYVGSNIPRRTSANLSASGSVVTVPAGYYASAAQKAVAAGTATTPAKTINVTPTVSLNSSTGAISIGITGSSNITPTVTAGYISNGTAGTVSVSGSSTFNLATKTAASYTPSSTTQTIPSGVYLTGAQTIEPIPISVDNHRLILPEGLISV